MYLATCLLLACFSYARGKPIDECIHDPNFMLNLEQHNKIAYYNLQSLHRSNHGWIFVNKKDGVTVHKRFLQDAPVYLSANDVIAGKKHAIVKSTGIIDAPPKDVFDLFLNNDRVKEYNEHCEVLKDVHTLPRQGLVSWSKIAWAASPKYSPFKAREFCSVVSYLQHANNGTYYILNRPAYLSMCPNHKGRYVKATILLAGNILEPHGDDGKQTKLTQIAHINPGGGADTAAIAWLINKVCAVGPPSFVRKLEVAARKTVAVRQGLEGPIWASGMFSWLNLRTEKGMPPITSNKGCMLRPRPTIKLI
jgi:hypothetical protein